MRKILLNLLILTGFVLFTQTMFAQTGVKGVIKDSETKEVLAGATVRIQNTTEGVATDYDGKFLLETKPGSYKLELSFMGYDQLLMDVTIEEGNVTDIGSISLVGSAIGIAGVAIMADRARERETPVAFSNVNKQQLRDQLGSRDIPLALDVTPNVYSTMQGGGAGDARINVRGFNQRNVAIMINGVPVNDMENGWVYWSNWDGVGDATSSIQMQRGLSAVNLATPSIGGTMNVITNPAEQKGGFTYKQEFGSGSFYKSTIFGHTGLIDGKYAFSAGGVRKVGTGVIDRTWTDAWAYYLGASWNINSKNRIEVYAIGAPQRHGQNLYKQNIAAYNQEYASDVEGYDVSTYNYDLSGYTEDELAILDEEIGLDELTPTSAFEEFPEATSAGSQSVSRLYGDQYSGRFYNQNWGPVDYKYKGQQSWNGNYYSRYNSDYINERENYYHKPIVNLNWYSQFSDKVSLFTTGYYSGGKGGGTGTYGSIIWDDDSGPSRTADWNATIENNRNNVDSLGNDLGSKGILRNSVNNQWTVGLISKLRWEISERFKMSFGIDGRTAEIQHYREVRDLLGGRFIYFDRNEFDSSDDYEKNIGDKIDNDFTNTVNWLGGYAQGEYNFGSITAYGTFGYSMIKYNYTNHFVKEEGTDNELKANTDWIGGYQAKGGFSYRFTETVNAFANVGYVSKVPIFDAVINDRDGTTATDPDNEKFTSVELGATYKTINNRFFVTGNFYYTLWKDRTLNRGIQLEDGSEGFIFITGMDQRHYGFELEGKYMPFDQFGFIFAGSINNWEYTSNVTGEYKDYANPDEPEEYGYFVKGLKVGDAPQTQGILGIEVYPVKRWKIQLLVKHYRNHYADWDPFSRTDPNDTEQVWKTPAYTVFDLHTDYTVPVKGDLAFNIFLHIFNLFDEMYIQDAVDNSAYNGYKVYDLDATIANGDDEEMYVNPHSADAAEVFLGLPRIFNFGVIIEL